MVRPQVFTGKQQFYRQNQLAISNQFAHRTSMMLGHLFGCIAGAQKVLSHRIASNLLI